MLRSGNLTGTVVGGNSSTTGISTKFNKIIHVGHSFGSAQTYALVNMYPNISDGIVLTGFSMNGSFVGLFTAGNNFQQAYINEPLRFGNASTLAAVQAATQYIPALQDLIAPIDVTTIYQQSYAPGYLVASNWGATEYLFFYPYNYNPQVLYIADKTKQPVTVGEALTLSSLPMTNAFAKPVLVFGARKSTRDISRIPDRVLIDPAEHDLPYCGGDCLATGNASVPSIPSQVSKNMPNAKPFVSYIQPNTGHGIQLHYNATAGNQYIMSFLKSNGL